MCLPDEPVHERAGGLCVRRMDDQPRRLVHNQEMLVFEENREGRAIGFDRPDTVRGKIRNVDRHYVAGRDARRDPANGLTIDADGSSIDPRLDPGAGGLEVRQMSAKHEIQPPPGIAAIGENCADRHVLASIVSAALNVGTVSNLLESKSIRFIPASHRAAARAAPGWTTI